MNTNQINSKFEELYDLLMQKQLNLSYLDLFRVTRTIYDLDSVNSIFYDLLPNTGASVAIDSGFTFNGTIYNRGDILFKQLNYEPLKIAGAITGVYYPNFDLSTSTNLQMQWQYTASGVNIIPQVNWTLSYANLQNVYYETRSMRTSDTSVSISKIEDIIPSIEVLHTDLSLHYEQIIFSNDDFSLSGNNWIYSNENEINRTVLVK